MRSQHVGRPGEKRKVEAVSYPFNLLCILILLAFPTKLYYCAFRLRSAYRHETFYRLWTRIAPTNATLSRRKQLKPDESLDYGSSVIPFCRLRMQAVDTPTSFSQRKRP